MKAFERQDIQLRALKLHFPKAYHQETYLMYPAYFENIVALLKEYYREIMPLLTSHDRDEFDKKFANLHLEAAEQTRSCMQLQATSRMYPIPRDFIAKLDSFFDTLVLKAQYAGLGVPASRDESVIKKLKRGVE